MALWLCVNIDMHMCSGRDCDPTWSVSARLDDVWWSNSNFLFHGVLSKFAALPRPRPSVKTHHSGVCSSPRPVDDIKIFWSRSDQWSRRRSLKYNACKWRFCQRSRQNGGLPVGVIKFFQETILFVLTWCICVANFVHLRESTWTWATFEIC